MEGRSRPSELPGDDHQCRMQFLLDIKPNHGSERFHVCTNNYTKNHHSAMIITFIKPHDLNKTLIITRNCT